MRRCSSPSPARVRACCARRSAADGERVAFAEMEELGRNPGRIIGAWRDFIRAHGGGDAPPLGIGEPIWPERTEAELVECQRHETLLNLAFTPETPWTLLCPYDAGQLAPEVLEAARRNHPHVARARRYAAQRRPTRARSRAPSRCRARRRAGGAALRRRRPRARARVPRRPRGARGLPARRRVADLVLAVDELATNSLRYARGEGMLRTWRENGSLLVEVADDGHIADPLAGRDCPPRRDRRPRPVPGQPALRPGAAALVARRQRDPGPHAPGLNRHTGGMAAGLVVAQALSDTLGGGTQPDLLEARQMQALSLGVHIPLVCFGIAFPAMFLFVEGRTCARATRRSSGPRRWSKVALTLFAVGVVTGTILSFEFGLLWPEFMATFGQVFGIAFGAGGDLVLRRGDLHRDLRLRLAAPAPRAHFLTGVPIVLSGFAGSFNVIAVNGWMNDPQGFDVVDGKVVNPRPWDALINDADVARADPHVPGGLHRRRLHRRRRVRVRVAARPARRATCARRSS